MGKRGWFPGRLFSRFDGYAPSMRLADAARRNGQPGSRADGRQCLSAKAERADRQKIIALKLRRGMALDREFEIGGGHAFAVVGDADQPAASAVSEDVDTVSAGVERIFDQFLHDARRP